MGAAENFTIGVNLPWGAGAALNGGGYAKDIGGSSDSFRIAANNTWLNNKLATRQNDLVRLFFFCDCRSTSGILVDGSGVPTGIRATASDDMTVLLDAAAANGVTLMPVLLDAVTMGTNSTAKALITDPTKRAALISVLAGFVNSYKGNALIHSWDIINEPLYLVTPLSGTGLPQATVTSFIKELLAACKALAPDETYTLGTSGRGGLTRNYTNNRLDLSGSDGFDMYSVHYYNNHESTQSMSYPKSALGVEAEVGCMYTEVDPTKMYSNTDTISEKCQKVYSNRFSGILFWEDYGTYSGANGMTSDKHTEMWNWYNNAGLPGEPSPWGDLNLSTVIFLNFDDIPPERDLSLRNYTTLSSATIDSVNSKFPGKKSMTHDSYLSFAKKSSIGPYYYDFDLGYANEDYWSWTMDFFVRITNEDLISQASDDFGNLVSFINYGTPNSWRWDFGYSSPSGLYFYAKNSPSNLIPTIHAGPSGVISDTDWHHVALIKVGTEYGIYLDGYQVAYESSNFEGNWTGNLNVGPYKKGTQYHLLPPYDYQGAWTERQYEEGSFVRRGSSPYTYWESVVPLTAEEPGVGSDWEDVTSNYRGTWDSEETYYEDEWVYYSLFYKCLASGVTETPSSTATYWDRQTNPGMVWYEPDPYSVNDLVLHTSSLWTPTEDTFTEPSGASLVWNEVIYPTNDNAFEGNIDEFRICQDNPFNALPASGIDDVIEVPDEPRVWPEGYGARVMITNQYGTWSALQSRVLGDNPLRVCIGEGEVVSLPLSTNTTSTAHTLTTIMLDTDPVASGAIQKV